MSVGAGIPTREPKTLQAQRPQVSHLEVHERMQGFLEACLAAKFGVLGNRGVLIFLGPYLARVKLRVVLRVQPRIQSRLPKHSGMQLKAR